MGPKNHILVGPRSPCEEAILKRAALCKYRDACSELCCTSDSCSAAPEMGDRLATIDIHGRKLGAVPQLWGKLDPHVTQCGLGRCLPSYQVAS